MEKFWLLNDWSTLQISIRGIRSLDIPSVGHREVDDRILELTVDDTGRWLLQIWHADHYKADSRDEEAPPVWSLRLLLNLTRTFTRMPNRVCGTQETLTTEGGPA